MQPDGERPPCRRKALSPGTSEPAPKRLCTSSSQLGALAGRREGRGPNPAAQAPCEPTFVKQGPRSEQGSPRQPATPDIRSTLASLGLSAKAVFACGELQLLSGLEQAVGPGLESKLADLLQQLWAWAVRKGKMSPDEPVTELQLASVAQWGLQRMRAGAVQAADSQPEAVEDSTRSSSNSSCGLGAAELQDAAEAAERQAALMAREEAAVRSVQVAAAAQQAEGLLLSCWLNLLQQVGQGGVEGRGQLPPPLPPQQQRQSRVLPEVQPSQPAFPTLQLLRRTSSGPPFSSPKPAPPLPPLPLKPGRPSRPNTAVRRATPPSAEQLGQAGWMLGELSAAELQEHPGFTATLKEAVASFDLYLASHGMAFNYTPAQLRQACLFVVRDLLSNSQKQTLARDREGVFQVVLQACGLIQHMESSLLKLQLSVARKCGRIASAAAGLGDGAEPDRVASGCGGSGVLG